MTLAILYVGATGLLLGFASHQALAVLAASSVVVAGGNVLTVMADWPLLESLAYCATLLVTLQISYLVGWALACAHHAR